jgi:hypothetical protein
VINNIIDYSNEKKILPLKIVLGINILKKYIQDNKIKLVQYGIEYILQNKKDILNFSFDNSDNNNDDNESIKSCINKTKKIIKLEDSILKDSEIFNLIIEIKNKAQYLDKDDLLIIKTYIEILIICLEKTRNLFI